MEELGREYGQIYRNYACDCCGVWIPKGHYATVVAYRVPVDHYPEFGCTNLKFEWLCMQCDKETC